MRSGPAWQARAIGPFASQAEAAQAGLDDEWMLQEGEAFLREFVTDVSCGACPGGPAECEGWIWTDATPYRVFSFQHPKDATWWLGIAVDSTPPGDPNERTLWVSCSSCGS